MAAESRMIQRRAEEEKEEEEEEKEAEVKFIFHLKIIVFQVRKMCLSRCGEIEGRRGLGEVWGRSGEVWRGLGEVCRIRDGGVCGEGGFPVDCLDRDSH